MTQQPETLPVIFRADKRGDHKGTVTAYFPTLAGTRDPWTCQSYAHIGQHSAAHRDFYSDFTRPATPEEAAPLLAELRHIYESGALPCPPITLKSVARWTRHHDAARRASLESLT